VQFACELGNSAVVKTRLTADKVRISCVLSIGLLIIINSKVTGIQNTGYEQLVSDVIIEQLTVSRKGTGTKKSGSNAHVTTGF
jgi:hypothetical protein